MTAKDKLPALKNYLAYKHLAKWLVENKLTIFLEADLPKETKKTIMNSLGFSSRLLDE
jgi:hypothetical protein